MEKKPEITAEEFLTKNELNKYADSTPQYVFSYTIALEAIRLSRLEQEEKIKAIIEEKKELWGMLEEINAIMWNSYMIKEIEVADGEKIMTVLEKWASKY